MAGTATGRSHAEAQGTRGKTVNHEKTRKRKPLPPLTGKGQGRGVGARFIAPCFLDFATPLRVAQNDSARRMDKPHSGAIHRVAWTSRAAAQSGTCVTGGRLPPLRPLPHPSPASGRGLQTKPPPAFGGTPFEKGAFLLRASAPPHKPNVAVPATLRSRLKAAHQRPMRQAE